MESKCAIRFLLNDDGCDATTIVKSDYASPSASLESIEGPRDLEVSSKRPKKTFSCNLCGVSFRRNFHLKRHVKNVHLRQRPFACEWCEAQFGLKSNLQTHCRNMHQKLRMFKCVECSATFKQKAHLEKHVKHLHC
mmetsp:Transcript_12082/g.36847  ORF Transcript_12082/g.36847 Transcript_12082/m.36847 type:complete len:136 (-) Transcript_12082:547-954(-)